MSSEPADFTALIRPALEVRKLGTLDLARFHLIERQLQPR